MHFKFDVTNGKELDVANMTLGQLKAIYEAQSDKVKKMQESGELSSLHSDFDAVETSYVTSQLKIMDTIDRTLVQIGQAEEEIYDSLAEADGTIRTADASGLLSMVSLSTDDRTLANLQIAEGMAENASDHAVLANSLK